VLRALHLECPLARPSWVTAGCFSLHGRGELSGVALIVESQINLWTTGIPHQRRRVVAGRLLLIHETSEHHLRFRKFIAADGCIWLRYRAHDEVGSRLAVLEEMPRHFGHGLLAYKEARPAARATDGP
jgi:hypothetical protein